MENGSLGILNVGVGDIKLSFDKDNPEERAKAAKIVKDMLRRGYAILIKVGEDAEGKPTYKRVQDFDENTYEYLISDFGTADTDTAEVAAVAPSAEPVQAKPKKTRRTTRVSADATTGVAIARTAGG